MAPVLLTLQSSPEVLAGRRGCSQRSLIPRQGRLGCTRTLRQGWLTTRAVQGEKQEAKPEIAKFADSIGLPTDEGIFGFRPFPEVWVGRLAMAGFVSSVVGEFLTSKGSLQQVGLLTPNPWLFTVILAAATGASVFGFARTLSRAQTGNLSTTELKRYGKFLGISNEANAISETETEMKGNWNKNPNSPPQGLTGSSSQNPTDTFQKDVGTAGSQLPENEAISAAADDQQFANPGLRYARNVEITNGRAAMLGFLITTLVEAWTGKGILSQVLWELKLLNILGPASGF